ncbi:glucosidase [Candidatus Sumerlaeota bacterium]|nr:glucosidase [Candidatus Sumerlaeota bacterium]
MTRPLNAEAHRLREDGARRKNWKRWGPYLSERQWGTVREDYSRDGNCWDYFPHDQARSRAYRWGEDGLLGICDRLCRLCFSVALWNGKDPILKERLFGLGNEEGNHGEDVKECYYYLDSTPTHSYMRALYKYPQSEFPYQRLLEENRRRGRADAEFELVDTGIFDEGRYFDVSTEYAKADDEDLLIRIHIVNRGPEEAELHVLPTVWFRNTWAWGCTHEGCTLKPRMELEGDLCLKMSHETLGKHFFVFDGEAPVTPQILFTDNHTNFERLFGVPNEMQFVKDAFHDYLIHANREAVNPKQRGTKAAAHYQLRIAAGGSATIRCRLAELTPQSRMILGADFEKVFETRRKEADEFYSGIIPASSSEDQRNMARQCYAGLLWSKQFYHYIVKDWLLGDPDTAPPPQGRLEGRNSEWQHLYSRDIISMPDKWEYPWFAAWDVAFHMIAFSQVDPAFAKQQLELFLREWYMHPNGQLPAYEFAFGDVNPPVHAWAVWRVYKITAPRGERDIAFLERCFHKLLMNFTWWVNRKDPRGKNIFSGGFLGLDNIGVFDRSKPMPHGAFLEQADGTAWMAFYCGTMLSMALELAEANPSYEDIASKFFEHFVTIADAINHLGGSGLWDEEDGLYYDQIFSNGRGTPLRIRSLVGVVPLFAVEVLEQETIDRLPGFKKRMEWFLANRQDLAQTISYMQPRGSDSTMMRLLAIPSRTHLERVLKYVLSEDDFLSPFGIRSLSQYHREHPFTFHGLNDGETYEVHYVPGDSDTGVFGGNSNWRGPIWFPLNFLLIEALERYHHFFGEDLKMEYPTGSGQLLTLKEIAVRLAERLSSLFLVGEDGQRPIHRHQPIYAAREDWHDLILFYEYFHADDGRGVGASHQTGWTALIVRLLETTLSQPRGES